CARRDLGNQGFAYW
nr:immunoglobulin heavy chain junction region [Mus musculus]MBK4187548.1 immunoglobulin heavy chain junction region [Mus musculus]